MIELSMGRLSFVMTLIGATATIALLLAAIGLYGVLAYIVSLLSREISVRLAMGAMPASVARLVTGRGRCSPSPASEWASSRFSRLLGACRPPSSEWAAGPVDDRRRCECADGNGTDGVLNSSQASGARRSGAGARWRIATIRQRRRANLFALSNVFDHARAPEAGIVRWCNRRNMSEQIRDDLILSR
jgi:hypothetical protein